MTLNKTHLIVFLVGVLLGLCTGFFTGKAIYNKPIVEKVERDTIIVNDTIPHYFPQPVDGTTVRYITKYLPMVKRDTVTNDIVSLIHDTVAVEVPIESKHYHANEYDAWVSGFEPSLDSIKVYQRTEYITETITKTINPKRKPWGIGFHAGYGYDFKTKTAAPFVGVGISYDIISF